MTFLTGCSLFANTYHTLGARPPDSPFVAAMLAAPLLSLMKIHNMVIQLQLMVGQPVTTFDFYAINMGENKYMLNSKHKSFCTKA